MTRTDSADSGLRLREALALLLVGDGLLGLLRPSEHCAIWRTGSGRWDDAVEWFTDHPHVVRACAAAELAVGVWIAERQFDAAAVPQERLEASQPLSTP